MNSSLSADEIALAFNPEIMLVKNKIIQHVHAMFGELVVPYKQVLLVTDLYNLEEKNAKISKGENYKGLPYVMLDYPRHFGKYDIFAIRSFFWWGNFFSITLHLSGKYQQLFSVLIKKAIDQKVLEGWYLATGENEWEHHYENQNYKLIEQGDELTSPFLKISKKIPLSEWDKSTNFFIENFCLLISVLQPQAPIL